MTHHQAGGLTREKVEIDRIAKAMYEARYSNMPHAVVTPWENVKPWNKGHTLKQAKAALSAIDQAAQIEALKPPPIAEACHWLGDIGLEKHGVPLYFKDETEAIAFIDWMSARAAASLPEEKQP